ncbi:MAG: PD-(D/E)XK nuclease family protein [Actinomycetota bacterium]
MAKLFKVNPSDFAFLWDECQRCFYRKVVLGITRPRTPMAKVFILIDGLMKRFYLGAPTSSLSPTLAAGRIEAGDMWLRSKPIEIEGHGASCYIVGRPDSIIAFEDGSYGVIDFKTSRSKDNHVALYSRQLHSYGYALENPAPRAEGLYPITTYGLHCVTPISMGGNGAGLSFEMEAIWIPIEKEENKFLEFMDEVLTVLERRTPPDAGEECLYCRYFHEGIA